MFNCGKCNVPFTFGLIAGLTVLIIPALFNWELNVSSPPIYSALFSSRFRDSIILSIGFALPIMIDLVQDYFTYPLQHLISPTSLSLKAILITIVIVPNLLILFFAIPYQSIGYLFVVLCMRPIIIARIILPYLINLHRPEWTWKRCYFAFMMIIIGRIFTLYAMYCNQVLASVLGLAGFVSHILGGVIILYSSTCYLMDIRKEYTEQILPESINIAVMQTLFLNIVLISLTVIDATLITLTWISISSAHLISLNLTFTIPAIIFFCFQSRVIHQKFIQNNRELEGKKGFIRFLSHEIRTPLNIAKVGFDLLKHEIQYEPLDLIKVLKTVAEIENANDLAVETLNTILAVDKIDDGQLIIEPSEVNALEYVAGTVQPFQLQARAKNIELAIEFPLSSPLILISIDKHKFGLVLRNIVSNALKFTPAGGKVTIYYEICQLNTPQCSIKFHIRDTGAGLSENEQGKLFHSIIQFHPGELQQGGGTGLGMYLSKGIMNAHNGSISVRSPGSGLGSTFTIELACKILPQPDFERSATQTIPHTGRAATDRIFVRDIFSNQVMPFNATESVPEVETIDSISPAAIARWFASKTVLVVDDADSNRRMVARMLARKFGTCLEARDGAEAVALVRAAMAGELTDDKGPLTIDVITMDNYMPVMNGPSATRAIRALGFTGKIIGVTGNALEEDMSNFLSSGVEVVMIKPINIATLDAHLIRLFGLR